MSNSSNSANKSWFNLSGDGSGFRNRVEQINKYRSPHTKADEILRILKWGVQPLLIVYCMVLSFASYQAFFGHNFSTEIATLGAVLLCIVIEFGKIKIGSYVFQKPFLEGMNGLGASFAEFSVWFGALLFAGVAFYMSVINSTTGAHSLSIMKGSEKNEISFSTNTDEIDAQIAATNARIKQNAGIKWRGTVTYQAQKAIERDTRSLESLNRQREAAINTQRLDFERGRDLRDTNTQTGANLLMASGGWVELLQVIALFLIAACMSVVGGVMDKERPTSHFEAENIVEQLFSKKANTNGFSPRNSAKSAPIGFSWPGYGEPTDTDSNTVSQSPDSVTQQTGQFSVIGCDAVLRDCRKKVQTDLPNFGRADAKPETVSARINGALDECYEILTNPDFKPSRQEGISFYKFMVETAVPTLNGRGFPYERDTFLLKRLLDVMPQADGVEV